MPQERRLLPVTMDGLMRTLRPVLTPEAKAQFRKIGVDPESPNRLSGYALTEWHAAADLARGMLFPKLGRPEGAYELGRAFTRGYFETMSGKALLALLRLLGPHRAIERTPDNLRSGNPYIDSTVTKRGPNEYEVFVSYVLPDPEFTQGLIEEGTRLAGGKNARAKILGREGEGATFHIQWD